MRFGIGMNTDHTLEEVGQQFSVTRERIRQIEAKALRKLKHPSRSRKLRRSWITDPDRASIQKQTAGKGPPFSFLIRLSPRHRERSEAIHRAASEGMDCFVAIRSSQ